MRETGSRRRSTCTIIFQALWSSVRATVPSAAQISDQLKDDSIIVSCTKGILNDTLGESSGARGGKVMGCSLDGLPEDADLGTRGSGESDADARTEGLAPVP